MAESQDRNESSDLSETENEDVQVSENEDVPVQEVQDPILIARNAGASLSAPAKAAIAPLKIHISNCTKEILDKLGGFATEERGNIQLKGKGSLVTHWLLEADASVPRSPHREMKPPDVPIPKHTGPAGMLIKEFHNSTISLRGSMRGSFRNSPAVCRNGGLVNHESPIAVRWKTTEDEQPNGCYRENAALIS